MRIGKLIIGLLLLSSNVNAQAPIIKCPVDTNVIFEIGIKIYQTHDSLGKIQKQAWLDYAIPTFEFREKFVDPESKEECTPYSLVYENNQIYIFDSIAYSLDSTGEWKFNSEFSKKVLLNPNKVLSLKIQINNETDKVVDLSEVNLLENLNFPIQFLEVSFIYHSPKKARFNIKKWNFVKFPLQLYSISIEVPINQRKKRVLKSLDRFKNLEDIHIRNYKEDDL